MTDLIPTAGPTDSSCLPAVGKREGAPALMRRTAPDVSTSGAAGISPQDAQAVDRLAFHLLRDAYCDLAGVMMTADADIARAVLGGIERRLTETLGRFHSETAEGAASTAIVIAVGDRIGDVMDEAQQRLGTGAPARMRAGDRRG